MFGQCRAVCQASAGSSEDVRVHARLQIPCASGQILISMHAAAYSACVLCTGSAHTCIKGLRGEQGTRVAILQIGFGGFKSSLHICRNIKNTKIWVANLIRNKVQCSVCISHRGGRDAESHLGISATTSALACIASHGCGARATE